MKILLLSILLFTFSGSFGKSFYENITGKARKDLQERLGDDEFASMYFMADEAQLKILRLCLNDTSPVVIKINGLNYKPDTRTLMLATTEYLVIFSNPDAPKETVMISYDKNLVAINAAPGSGCQELLFGPVLQLTDRNLQRLIGNSPQYSGYEIFIPLGSRFVLKESLFLATENQNNVKTWKNLATGKVLLSYPDVLEFIGQLDFSQQF
ncbi:hypothetical protein GVN16_08525 [Emticicia sp. CRIBPO]|uniref:hypothetical protein n=1 Tax=Emticicia sp. CRIBPO TaxID=2683258 RepID=UPI001412769D|nr:hypothetical protein [Emticicia sp. CRIBPO]NBA85801.1 hypothetical protein [Emticicia sp. CRIBPO]